MRERMKAVVGKTVVAEAASEVVVSIDGNVAFDGPGPDRELTQHTDR